MKNGDGAMTVNSLILTVVPRQQLPLSSDSQDSAVRIRLLSVRNFANAAAKDDNNNYITSAAPDDDDDEAAGNLCPITLQAFVNCTEETTPAPLSRYPAFTCAEIIPCGHRFVAIPLLTHFTLNDIRCPVCRRGSPLSMSPLATCPGEPWARALNADLTHRQDGGEGDEGAPPDHNRSFVLHTYNNNGVNGSTNPAEQVQEDDDDNNLRDVAVILATAMSSIFRIPYNNRNGDVTPSSVVSATYVSEVDTHYPLPAPAVHSDAVPRAPASGQQTATLIVGQFGEFNAYRPRDRALDSLQRLAAFVPLVASFWIHLPASGSPSTARRLLFESHLQCETRHYYRTPNGITVGSDASSDHDGGAATVIIRPLYCLSRRNLLQLSNCVSGLVRGRHDGDDNSHTAAASADADAPLDIGVQIHAEYIHRMIFRRREIQASSTPARLAYSLPSNNNSDNTNIQGRSYNILMRSDQISASERPPDADAAHRRGDAPDAFPSPIVSIASFEYVPGIQGIQRIWQSVGPFSSRFRSDSTV